MSKEKELQAKKAKLVDILEEMGSVLVGFSGGVDSSLLLAMASRLPKVSCMAVTVSSISYAKHERRDANRLAENLGAVHEYIDIDQMTIPQFAANVPERCYYCKKAIFTALQDLAKERGYTYVVDGSNTDDELDYRPGKKALQELGVRSPLAEAGLSKAEIREISREMGLFTAAKPSYACLASRIPYGEPITPAKLARVEQAEELLQSIGFSQVRVRSHGNLARLEVNPAQITLLCQPKTRERVVAALKAFGYLYVCVDLVGFQSGSMNRELTK